jgi:hypothetical protein
VLAERPTVFDNHGLAFDEAAFVQTPAERSDQMGGIIGRPGAEKPNHRHCGLLRARCERHRERRAAESRNELAPLHVHP